MCVTYKHTERNHTDSMQTLKATATLNVLCLSKTLYMYTHVSQVTYHYGYLICIISKDYLTRLCCDFDRADRALKIN